MTRPTATTKPDEMSFAQTAAALARHYMSGRRGLILPGVIVLAAGLALSWSWVVAIGLAPILLALAPCAVMCALGVCMNRMGGKSCSKDMHQQRGPDTPKEQKKPAQQG